MENATLIILIIALIILLALCFFIFQIWVQSKETKLQLANFLQELQRGFTNTESNLKGTIDLLREQLKQTDSDLKKVKEEISEQINATTNSTNIKLNEALESLKNQTLSRIGELNDTVKMLKEQLDDRVKELDKHLTGKLVEDLTSITKQYSEKLNEKHLAILSEFTKTSKEIKEEQKKLFKAITEPLKINADGHD
jgi:preprotein translocase subunit YajC